MFGDSPYARPQSSYDLPAQVITVDPDTDANYSVCFRSEWLPYVVGALSQLLAQTTWATNDPDELNLVQARAQLLIALFMEGCPPPSVETGCTDYPPSAYFVSYYPMNPYTEPGTIPDWYSIAPLVLIDSDLAAAITGTQIGDIIALNGAFPNPDAIAEHGLTSIHIDLAGPCKLKLTFVEIPAGGIAAVTVDDDGLHTRFVDTGADIIEVPPETPGDFVEEFIITGEGAHHVDIRFTPVLDDSFVVLRYGGGLRSIAICATEGG